MAGLTANYADALFHLAREHGALDEWLAQAALIRDALKDGKGRGAMEHPRMTRADKRSFLSAALPPGIHDDLVGFLHMLIAQRQEKLIVPVLTEFVDRGTRQDEKMLAHVISAAELKQGQAAALERVLAQKLGRPIELSIEIDPSLIGGLCIYVNGLVIDRTVKKQLGDLRDTIKRGGAV